MEEGESVNRQETLGAFAILPPELILNIFSYLKLEDLLSLRVVSKGFRQVSSDDFLWKPHCQNFGFRKIKDIVWEGPETLEPLGRYASYFNDTIARVHSNWINWNFKEDQWSLDYRGEAAYEVCSDDQHFVVVTRSAKPSIHVYDLPYSADQVPYIIQLPDGVKCPYEIYVSNNSIFVLCDIGAIFYILTMGTWVLRGPLVTKDKVLLKILGSQTLLQDCHCTKNFVYLIYLRASYLHVICMKTCRIVQSRIISNYRLLSTDEACVYFYIEGVIHQMEGTKEIKFYVEDQPTMIRSNNGIVAACFYCSKKRLLTTKVFSVGVFLWKFEKTTEGSLEIVNVISETAITLIVWLGCEYKLFFIEDRGNSLRIVSASTYPMFQTVFVPSFSFYWGLTYFREASLHFFRPSRTSLSFDTESVFFDRHTDMIYIDHNMIVLCDNNRKCARVLNFRHVDGVPIL